MDYSNKTPERYWITNPDAHPKVRECVTCGTDLDRSKSIPFISSLKGGLCQKDATDSVQDHPVTPTYLEWLTKGDPRWWSAWCCNCEGCVPHENGAA